MARAKLLNSTVPRVALFWRARVALYSQALKDEGQEGLLEAAEFMDAGECETLIRTACEGASLAPDDFLPALERTAVRFRQRARKRFGRDGEAH